MAKEILRIQLEEGDRFARDKKGYLHILGPGARPSYYISVNPNVIEHDTIEVLEGHVDPEGLELRPLYITCPVLRPIKYRKLKWIDYKPIST